MSFCGVELEARVGLEFRQLTVDSRPHEPLAGQLLHHVAELTLLLLDHRREQHHPRVLRQREQLLDDVSRAQARNRLAALRAVRLADVGEQQAQIIVNLGGGGDGRTRVAAGGTLLDGDRRREPLDVIDVRLLQLIEELPGVRGERLDVFALSLGEQRVERQRRFPRAAGSGDHHQLVTGNLKRQILEIMLPCPGYFYKPLGHRKLHPKPPQPLGQAWVSSTTTAV